MNNKTKAVPKRERLFYLIIICESPTVYYLQCGTCSVNFVYYHAGSLKTVGVHCFSSAHVQVPPKNIKQKKSCKTTTLFIVVRTVGLEPTRSPIRPSNVRVCQFRHARNSFSLLILYDLYLFVKDMNIQF